MYLRGKEGPNKTKTRIKRAKVIFKRGKLSKIGLIFSFLGACTMYNMPNKLENQINEIKLGISFHDI